MPYVYVSRIISKYVKSSSSRATHGQREAHPSHGVENPASGRAQTGLGLGALSLNPRKRESSLGVKTRENRQRCS